MRYPLFSRRRCHSPFFVPARRQSYVAMNGQLRGRSFCTRLTAPSIPAASESPLVSWNTYGMAGGSAWLPHATVSHFPLTRKRKSGIVGRNEQAVVYLAVVNKISSSLSQLRLTTRMRKWSRSALLPSLFLRCHSVREYSAGVCVASHSNSFLM